MSINWKKRKAPPLPEVKFVPLSDGGFNIISFEEVQESMMKALTADYGIPPHMLAAIEAPKE